VPSRCYPLRSVLLLHQSESMACRGENRARKVGDAYEIEKKLEERWDDEEGRGVPAKIVEWVNKVLSGEPGFVPCNIEGKNGMSWHVIQEFLRDGSILCQLLNKLRESAGMEKTPFKKQAKVAFQAMNNVSNFNKGAEEYGVPKSATFQTIDVMDGRKGPMVNVLNCLNQLGFVANQRGYQPSYEPVPPPKLEDE